MVIEASRIPLFGACCIVSIVAVLFAFLLNMFGFVSTIGSVAIVLIGIMITAFLFFIFGSEQVEVDNAFIRLKNRNKVVEEIDIQQVTKFTVEKHFVGNTVIHEYRFYTHDEKKVGFSINLYKQREVMKLLAYCQNINSNIINLTNQ